MDGVTGQHLDWGKGRFCFMRCFKPVPLEFYPGQTWGREMAAAPTTSDAGKCKELYEMTERIVANLRIKYKSHDSPC